MPRRCRRASSSESTVINGCTASWAVGVIEGANEHVHLEYCLVSANASQLGESIWAHTTSRVQEESCKLRERWVRVLTCIGLSKST